MSDDTKIRVRRSEQRIEILALVPRPTNGTEKAGEAASGETARNFVERVEFSVDGRPVANVFLSPHIASYPLTGVAVDGINPGDRASVRWQDTEGNTGGAEAVSR